MTRFLPLALLTAVLLLAIPAVNSQPAPTPILLPPGESVLACTNGATPTLIPPNRVICPATPSTPTRTVTPTPPPTVTPVVQPGGFLATFDGLPGTPEPFLSSSTWDITTHSRDEWYSLDAMGLDHSPDCGPPPAQHHSTSYEAAVYRCTNHLMVGIHGDGYAAAYLTPNHMVDLSRGTAVISWRMSTFRASIDRSWVDVWISPYENHLQLPLPFSFPDLQGPPRHGLLIRMQATRNSFEVFRIDNFDMTRIGGGFIGYESRFVPSKTIRDLFEIQLTAGSVQVSMPEHGLVFVNRSLTPPLTWTAGVIQWGIHDYNSDKSTGSSCVVPLPCTPSTWHFDNFSINPSIPFTIIPDNNRWYQAGVNVATFTSPAPVNAYLRFAGIGSNLQVSFDGGATWQTAARQPGGDAHDPGHFASYFMPIPAGVSEVRFRGGRWYGGDWHVRDASIWAR